MKKAWKHQNKKEAALVIVDLQNDFCPGGALAVPNADTIVSKVNKYIRYFHKNKLVIFASRDWHPVKTQHFKDFGGLWPVHCIQNTWGANFHPKLKLPKETILLYKGMDPKKDSYSVFQAEDRQGMSFVRLLEIFKIKELYFCGLATDYCVKSSCLDALRHGFKVKILLDAIKGVDLKKGDSEKALNLLFRNGAKGITYNQLEEER